MMTLALCANHVLVTIDTAMDCSHGPTGCNWSISGYTLRMYASLSSPKFGTRAADLVRVDLSLAQ